MRLMSVPFTGRDQTTGTRADFTFGGRLIVAVSDADMVASAYLDGHLGPLQGQDALSVIRLGKPVSQLTAVAIGASTSVTGPPSSVAVSPDGRYAVVIETRAPGPPPKPICNSLTCQRGKPSRSLISRRHTQARYTRLAK